MHIRYILLLKYSTWQINIVEKSHSFFLWRIQRIYVLILKSYFWCNIFQMDKIKWVSRLLGFYLHLAGSLTEDKELHVYQGMYRWKIFLVNRWSPLKLIEISNHLFLAVLLLTPLGLSRGLHHSPMSMLLLLLLLLPPAYIIFLTFRLSIQPSIHHIEGEIYLVFLTNGRVPGGGGISTWGRRNKYLG